MGKGDTRPPRLGPHLHSVGPDERPESTAAKLREGSVAWQEAITALDKFYSSPDHDLGVIDKESVLHVAAGYLVNNDTHGLDYLKRSLPHFGEFLGSWHAPDLPA